MAPTPTTSAAAAAPPPSACGRRRRVRSSSSALFRAAALVTAAALPASTAALAERDVLLRFYHLSGGSHWTRAEGWEQAAESENDDPLAEGAVPTCSWYGITCEADGDGAEEIVRIELQNNHLKGKISKHIWTLPSLREVDLRGNLIEDAGLEGFEGDDTSAPLETLVLSENRLTHLDGIKSVPTTLEELHVSSNAFDGSFPEEILRLKKLKVLRMSYNHGLGGTLPTGLGDLTKLRELELSYNALTGTIPTELGLLELAEFVGLDDNKFEGPVPDELQNMKNLRYLSLNNEQGDAGLLTGKLPSFADTPRLKELYLNGNAISGTVPADLFANSEVLELEIAIGLADNRLKGKLPKELARFKKLKIDLAGNEIVNIHNSLCHEKKWMGGLVGEFGCDAILCPLGTMGATDGRMESEEEPCVPCAGGEKMNPFLGQQYCDGETGPKTGTKYSSTSESGGGGKAKRTMSGGAKFLIVAVCLGVPLTLLVAYRRFRNQRERIFKPGDKLSNVNMAPKGGGDETFDSEMSSQWGGRYSADKQRSFNGGSPRRMGGDAVMGAGSSIMEDLEEVEIGVVKKDKDGVDRCIL